MKLTKEEESLRSALETSAFNLQRASAIILGG